MHRYVGKGIAMLALGSLPLLGNCTKIEEERSASEIREASTQTLAAALGATEGMETLSGALGEAELGSILDGPASYTLFAPNDAAFEELGEKGSALLEEAQRPLLAALIRDHLVPGHLTPEAIRDAIASHNGPVTMTTLGEGSLTFSMDDSVLTITNDAGSTASISGTSIAATNGVVIPLDQVLIPPAEDGGDLPQ